MSSATIGVWPIRVVVEDKEAVVATDSGERLATIPLPGGVFSPEFVASMIHPAAILEPWRLADTSRVVEALDPGTALWLALQGWLLWRRDLYPVYNAVFFAHSAATTTPFAEMSDTARGPAMVSLSESPLTEAWLGDGVALVLCAQPSSPYIAVLAQEDRVSFVSAASGAPLIDIDAASALRAVTNLRGFRDMVTSYLFLEIADSIVSSGAAAAPGALGVLLAGLAAYSHLEGDGWALTGYARDLASKAASIVYADRRRAAREALAMLAGGWHPGLEDALEAFEKRLFTGSQFSAGQITVGRLVDALADAATDYCGGRDAVGAVKCMVADVLSQLTGDRLRLPARALEFIEWMVVSPSPVSITEYIVWLMTELTYYATTYSSLENGEGFLILPPATALILVLGHAPAVRVKLRGRDYYVKASQLEGYEIGDLVGAKVLKIYPWRLSPLSSNVDRVAGELLGGAVTAKASIDDCPRRYALSTIALRAKRVIIRTCGRILSLPATYLASGLLKKLAPGIESMARGCDDSTVLISLEGGGFFDAGRVAAENLEYLARRLDGPGRVLYVLHGVYPVASEPETGETEIIHLNVPLLALAYGEPRDAVERLRQLLVVLAKMAQSIYAESGKSLYADINNWFSHLAEAGVPQIMQALVTAFQLENLENDRSENER